MILMREITAEYHSLAIGVMAYCSTPSIRYFMASSWSRVSMWISLARRSSALKDGGVHQFDNRRNVAFIGSQPVNGKIFIAVFVIADDIQREAFSHFFEDALRLLGLLEKVGNLRMRGYFNAQLARKQHLQFVDHDNLAWIC